MVVVKVRLGSGQPIVVNVLLPVVGGESVVLNRLLIIGRQPVVLSGMVVAIPGESVEVLSVGDGPLVVGGLNWLSVGDLDRKQSSVADYGPDGLKLGLFLGLGLGDWWGSNHWELGLGPVDGRGGRGARFSLCDGRRRRGGRGLGFVRSFLGARKLGGLWGTGFGFLVGVGVVICGWALALCLCLGSVWPELLLDLPPLVGDGFGLDVEGFGNLYNVDLMWRGGAVLVIGGYGLYGRAEILDMGWERWMGLWLFYLCR